MLEKPAWLRFSHILLSQYHLARVGRLVTTPKSRTLDLIDIITGFRGYGNSGLGIRCHK